MPLSDIFKGQRKDGIITTGRKKAGELYTQSKEFKAEKKAIRKSKR